MFYITDIFEKCLENLCHGHKHIREGSIPQVGDTTLNESRFVGEYAHDYAGIKIGPFGSALKGKTLEEGEFKIYNQANLINNDFDFSRHFVSAETFEELSAYEVCPGDILLSMMGTIGKCKIMPEGYAKGIMDSHLLKARLGDDILPEYFEYVYDKDYSDVVYEQLVENSNGTIMNGLNSAIVKNILIPLPPIDIQRKIIKCVKENDEILNSTIKEIEDLQISLGEYKKSLIREIVTGKKEV